MARIKRPDVPAGPVLDFFTALQELHLKAGQPSTRAIQRDLGRGVASHTTIHTSLCGPRLPSWGMTEIIVEELARRSRQNITMAVERFRLLWESAARASIAMSSLKAEETRVEEPFRESGYPSRHAALNAALDEIEALALRQSGEHTIPTGFTELDLLTGGLRPGCLAIIGSAPSVGKSTFLLDICRSSAMRFKLPAAIFSLEMTGQETQLRVLSAEAKVALHHMRSGMMTDDDWTRLARTMQLVADAPIWTTYSPRMTLEEIREKATALTRESRIKLVAIDGLNTLTSIEAEGVYSSNSIRVLRQLKELAIDLNVPIVATAQMRQGEYGDSYERPRMNDLWDGESIEALADIVILLNRPDFYDRESPRAGEIDLIVAKHRNGPVATVTLAFQGHYSRMVDLTPSELDVSDLAFKPTVSEAGETTEQGESE